MPHGSPHDFDFFHGAWHVAHRRLTRRLAGSDDWEEFGGSALVRPLLAGQGNVDDNVIDLPGETYRAVTLRSFDPASGDWSIWWLDGRAPHRLDPPLIGGFRDGRGLFLAEDVFEGRPIRVRFIWTPDAKGGPQWEQAFSADLGTTWETNWVMRFTPMG